MTDATVAPMPMLGRRLKTPDLAGYWPTFADEPIIR